MLYQEITPSAPFNQFIDCYWVLEFPKTTHPDFEKVIPDGQMEMIFHYKDQYHCKIWDCERLQPRSFLFGQLEHSINLMPSGESGIFGIRFKTTGASAFFPFDLYEVKGLYIELCAIEKSYLDLEEQMLSANSTAQRIRVFEKFFFKKICSVKTDHLLDSAITEINNGHLNGHIGHLAKKLNLSTKQLTRKFSNKIGLNPKQLVRISRLKKAVNLFTQSCNLTSVAHQIGYYDQSHFIKDFKEFVGSTPTEYLKKRHLLNNLFD